MEIKHDGKGQPFIEVGNLRITLVCQEARDPDKDWTSTHVLRIQAHREDGGLYKGPEYPIDGCNSACELLGAIGYLLAKKL